MTLYIIGVITGIFTSAVAVDMCGLATVLAKRLVQRAAVKIAEPFGSRLCEEWLADLEAWPAGFSRLVFAVSLWLIGARRIRAAVGRQPEERPTLRVLLKRGLAEHRTVTVLAISFPFATAITVLRFGMSSMLGPVNGFWHELRLLLLFCLPTILVMFYAVRRVIGDWTFCGPPLWVVKRRQNGKPLTPRQ